MIRLMVNAGTYVYEKKKQKSSDLTLKETVTLLSEVLSPKTSLFHKRWKCINLKKEDEDFTMFACNIKLQLDSGSDLSIINVYIWKK